LDRPARLLPVPEWVLSAAASLLGKGQFAQRLCGSLRVDIAKAKTVLGWSPPLSVDEGVRRVAADFLAREK
jgi:UDP-4-keto-D-QuiNAc 4-reductase